jgi:hypothetical protein
MASVAEGGAPQSVNPKNYRADQGFFLGIALVLSLLTALGFAQLALRGITDPVGAPFRVHLHAMLLGGWLVLFCTQNWLAFANRIAFHRTLGWTALALIAAIIVANYIVTLGVIHEGRAESVGHTPSSFMALGTGDTLCFAGLIAWAISKRRDTQWHRRLLFGATLIFSAAGFNRLLADLPPEITPFLSIGAQLAFLAAIALHDRKALGQVHGATIAVGVVLAIQHSMPAILPRIGLWNDLVASLVG